MTADVIDKKQELRRYFPTPFYRIGPKGLGPILDAIGRQLNDGTVEVANMRSQFLLANATGAPLQVHGVNADILRPRGFNMNDDRFRLLIEIMANSSKNIELIFERLIALFFGPTALPTGLLDVYSVRNHEIICEIDANALIVASTRSLFGATYLHTAEGDAYTGAPNLSWTGASLGDTPAGSTSMTMAALPAGIPASGIAELGTLGGPDYESKLYSLSGSTLLFDTPTAIDHPSGSALRGPQTPNNYPSGYIFEAELAADTTQTIAPGASQVTLGALPPGWPLAGTAYLGDPSGASFEPKGFTMVGSTMHFMGTTANSHTSGARVVIPNMPRSSVKTTLAQTVAQGANLGPSGELSVANSADFPTSPAAIMLARSFNNVEIVPFETRKIGDNTKVIVDPAYVFQQGHAPGETCHLMALQTAPRVSGLDYAFFLNDTDSLRNTFFNYLRRVKVTGCKIVFVIK